MITYHLCLKPVMASSLRVNAKVLTRPIKFSPLLPLPLHLLIYFILTVAASFFWGQTFQTHSHLSTCWLIVLVQELPPSSNICMGNFLASFTFLLTFRSPTTFLNVTTYLFSHYPPSFPFLPLHFLFYCSTYHLLRYYLYCLFLMFSFITCFLLYCKPHEGRSPCFVHSLLYPKCSE